jgi:signal transduction histidine kinase
LQGQQVRLWVRDTGCGIAAEDQERIFERFARGQGSLHTAVGEEARPRPEGSGLGLAIVKSIAQAHGGRVWVESVPGHGSLFTLELPQFGRDS